MTTIQRQVVHQPIAQGAISRRSVQLRADASINATAQQDVLVGTTIGFLSKSPGSAKILSLGLGALALTACQKAPVIAGSLNPLKLLDSAALDRNAFIRKIQSIKLYQDNSASRMAAIDAWEILSKADGYPEPTRSEFKHMRRLIESGQVLINVNDKVFEKNATSTLATYRMDINTVNLRSSWTPTVPRDRVTLIHELKHAIDDFRRFDTSDSPASAAYEGNSFPTEIEDPFSGLNIMLDASKYQTNPRSAVDFEVSAAISECQYLLAEVGLNPLDPSLKKDLTKIANALDQKGFFHTHDSNFDLDFLDDTMSRLAHYFNLPPGFAEYELHGVTRDVYKSGQNLTHLIEEIYTQEPTQGHFFKGGSRSSLKLQSTHHERPQFCLHGSASF